MTSSTRNHLPDSINEIVPGTAMTTVHIRLAGTDHTIVATVPTDTVADLHLVVGSTVTTDIEATDITLGPPTSRNTRGQNW